MYESIRRISISAWQIKKILVKQCTNIKRNEIIIRNIIDQNTFNLHNSILNNYNRYMKVTLKSKLIGRLFRI